MPHRTLAALGLAALGSTARAMPIGCGYAVARLGARLHYGVAAARRAAVRANLERALDFAGARHSSGVDRQVRAVFEAQGAFLFEWLRSTGGGRPAVELDGGEHLEAALAGGRGAVVVTCHLGNWEVVGTELARRGFPLAVVTGRQLGRFDEAVRAAKSRSGIQVVRRSDGARALVRALEANRILVLLVDGDVWRRGRMVSFLGRPTRLPCGAVRLALWNGAPLLAATMRRAGRWRFEARVLPPVAAARATRPEVIMQALLEPLEGAIARDPSQWCLFRSLWA